MFRNLKLGLKKGKQKILSKVTNNYNINTDKQYDEIVELYQLEKRKVANTQKKLIALIKSLLIFEKSYYRPQEQLLDVFKDFTDNEENLSPLLEELGGKVRLVKDSVDKFISRLNSECIPPLKEYQKRFESASNIMLKRDEAKVQYDDQLAYCSRLKDNLIKLKSHKEKTPKDELMEQKLKLKIDKNLIEMHEMKNSFRDINRDVKTLLVAMLNEKSTIYEPFNEKYFELINDLFAEWGEDVNGMKKTITSISQALNLSYQKIQEELLPSSFDDSSLFTKEEEEKEQMIRDAIAPTYDTTPVNVEGMSEDDGEVEEEGNRQQMMMTNNNNNQQAVYSADPPRMLPNIPTPPRMMLPNIPPPPRPQVNNMQQNMNHHQQHQYKSEDTFMEEVKMDNDSDDDEQQQQQQQYLYPQEDNAVSYTQTPTQEVVNHFVLSEEQPEPSKMKEQQQQQQQQEEEEEEEDIVVNSSQIKEEVEVEEEKKKSVLPPPPTVGVKPIIEVVEESNNQKEDDDESDSDDEEEGEGELIE